MLVIDKAEVYRECIKRIDEKVGKEMLSVTDVAKYCGIDRKTVRRRFKFEGGYITLVGLAHQMVYGK